MCLVPELGWLFEYFMWTCSGYSAHRRWKQIINLEQTIADGYVATDLQNELRLSCGSLFVGWLLLHIGNIGTHGRRQLFYITFINHYFGLSRDGIDVLSKYGYGVTLDMFDKMFKIV